jgi:hypothetical protein
MAKYFVAKVKEKTMANKKLWLGMLVIVLAFGLVMAGCDHNAGGDGGGETFPAPKGKLTINGLGSYNGEYIWLSGFIGSSKALYGFTDITGYPSSIAFKLVKISGGKAEVPLYTLNPSATSYSDAYIAYEGNDAATGFRILIINDNDGSLTAAEISALRSPVDSKSLSTGSFSNGNLTIDW